MDPAPAGDSRETEDLLRRAANGDRDSWGALLAQHRGRLRRMVALRLDRRVQGRLDPSDVVQDAYLEASARLPEYLERPNLPFFLWLRFLTGQKLVTLHRHHLGVHMRNASREVPLERGGAPAASSAFMAAELLGREPRPSEAAAQAEQQLAFHEALEQMDSLDREILALRHFEQLSNAEAARVLDLQESAASKRYIRAVRRLKEILTDLHGGAPEPQP